MPSNQLKKEWMEMMSQIYHMKKMDIIQLEQRLRHENEQLAKASCHIKALLAEHGAMAVELDGGMFIVTPVLQPPFFEFHAVDASLVRNNEKTAEDDF